MNARVRIAPEIELEGRIAATLENLVEALRLPADFPAREEYINRLCTNAGRYLAQRPHRRAA